MAEIRECMKSSLLVAQTGTCLRCRMRCMRSRNRLKVAQARLHVFLVCSFRVARSFSSTSGTVQIDGSLAGERGAHKEQKEQGRSERRNQQASREERGGRRKERGCAVFFQGLFIILVHGEPICNRLPLHMCFHITNAVLGKREGETEKCFAAVAATDSDHPLVLLLSILVPVSFCLRSPSSLRWLLSLLDVSFDGSLGFRGALRQGTEKKKKRADREREESGQSSEPHRALSVICVSLRAPFVVW